MKANLQTRMARLERALPPSEDDEFLGYADEQGIVKAPPAESLDWHERLTKAAEQLAGTMSEEHYEHVLRESCCGQGKSLRQLPNLARQFWRMAVFMALSEEERNRISDRVSNRKHVFSLPPEVAQIYIDHPLATAADKCRQCGYLCPAILWTGSSTDASARAAASLNLPLHPGFNGFQFFTRCPLCGGATGGSPELYFFCGTPVSEEGKR
jgi:hypothetical protein